MKSLKSLFSLFFEGDQISEGQLVIVKSLDLGLRIVADLAQLLPPQRELVESTRLVSEEVGDDVLKFPENLLESVLLLKGG